MSFHLRTYINAYTSRAYRSGAVHTTGVAAPYINSLGALEALLAHKMKTEVDVARHMDVMKGLLTDDASSSFYDTFRKVDVNKVCTYSYSLICPNNRRVTINVKIHICICTCTCICICPHMHMYYEHSPVF